jgi:Phospholipase_D-nuclease N-terminal
VRFVPWAVAIVLYVYCWVEIGQSDPRQVRVLPRLAWALVVAVPFFGAAAWLVYGRPNGSQARESAPRSQPQVVAPDDDPEFLRSLRKRPPDDD